MKMTTKQEATFIRKGARPIDIERRAIPQSTEKVSREKCSSSRLSLRIRRIQTSAMVCERMVATAAPWIPILKTKMKSGSSSVLMPTVRSVAAIAFCGWPETRTMELRPK